MAGVRNKNFYVHCSNCPVEDSNCKSSHATIVREDDGTTISIRLGKRQRVCSICFDTFVDSGRSMCFQCDKVVTLKTTILCKECRRPAVELPGVSSHEDFEEFDCPICVAEDCEESGLAVW